MYKCLSVSQLKYIALLSMVIDHIAASFLKGGGAFVSGDMGKSLYPIMRDVGRIAFPIFAFLLVEGFFHTRDRKRHLLRILVCAVCSEIPFDLAINHKLIDMEHQSIMVTIAIAYLTMFVIEEIRCMLIDVNPLMGGAAGIALAALGIMTGEVLHGDYGWRGVALILIFYFFTHYPISGVLAGGAVFVQNLFALPAFLLILCYNGKKGTSIFPRYFFYIFYPTHLLLFGGLLEIWHI